jgi:hypothetical protein
MILGAERLAEIAEDSAAAHNAAITKCDEYADLLIINVSIIKTSSATR